MATAKTADPFATLTPAFEDATNKNSGAPEYAGPIPASVISWVSAAVNTGKRVKIDVATDEQFDNIRSAVSTHVRNDYPGKAAFCRARTDEEGFIAAITFTVRDKPGRKPTAA